MFTVNDIEFWVVVWIIELTVLAQVIIRIHFRIPKEQKPKKSEILKITTLIVITQFSLVYAVGNYLLDSIGDICFADAVTQTPLNKNRVWECATGGNDQKLNLLIVNVGITLVGLFIQVFEKPIRSRK